MTLRKVTAGELLAGAAGVALLADLFAPWFGGETAWGSLSVLLVLLLISAGLGVCLLATTAVQRSQAYPVTAEVFGFAFAFVSALFLLVELIVRARPGWGAWAGLVLVLALAAGSWAAMRADVRA